MFDGTKLTSQVSEEILKLMKSLHEYAKNRMYDYSSTAHLLGSDAHDIRDSSSFLGAKQIQEIRNLESRCLQAMEQALAALVFNCFDIAGK